MVDTPYTLERDAFFDSLLRAITCRLDVTSLTLYNSGNDERLEWEIQISYNKNNTCKVWVYDSPEYLIDWFEPTNTIDDEYNTECCVDEIVDYFCVLMDEEQYNVEVI